MTDQAGLRRAGDTAPGDEAPDRDEAGESLRGYLIGLGLSILITAVAFYIARTSLV